MRQKFYEITSIPIILSNSWIFIVTLLAHDYTYRVWLKGNQKAARTKNWPCLPVTLIMLIITIYRHLLQLMVLQKEDSLY